MDEIIYIFEKCSIDIFFSLFKILQIEVVTTFYQFSNREFIVKVKLTWQIIFVYSQFFTELD